MIAEHAASHRPQHNLARYLIRHSGPVPRTGRRSPVQQAANATGDSDLAGRDPEIARALAQMRQVWSATRGYFPGREMPVPRFAGRDTLGAVGWADGRAVGIQYPRQDAAALSSRVPSVRDEALRTLIHEWAHNFQTPGTYRRGDQEGGAEAFAYAVAPKVAEAIGRPFGQHSGRALRYDNYRPDVARVLRRRGMGWIMRGQFDG